MPSRDLSLLVTGAAGFAAMSRVADLVETAGADMYGIGLLGTWANARIRDFRYRLKLLHDRQVRSGPAYTKTGWKLDKWEGR